MSKKHISFGRNILRPQDEDVQVMLNDAQCVKQVTELLIQNYGELGKIIRIRSENSPTCNNDSPSSSPNIEVQKKPPARPEKPLSKRSISTKALANSPPSSFPNKSVSARNLQAHPNPVLWKSPQKQDLDSPPISKQATANSNANLKPATPEWNRSKLKNNIERKDLKLGTLRCRQEIRRSQSVNALLDPNDAFPPSNPLLTYRVNDKSDKLDKSNGASQRISQLEALVQVLVKRIEVLESRIL